MRETPNFVRAEERAAPVDIDIRTDEQVIGWLPNPAPWTDTVVIFTSCALVEVAPGKTQRIEWDEVLDYEVPSKTESDGVRISTVNGQRVIRIAGSHGPDEKYKDAFSCAMILNALKRERERGPDG